MKYMECTNCGEIFAPKETINSNGKWFAECPECGKDTEFDVKDFLVPAGTLVKLTGPEPHRATIISNDHEKAATLDFVTYTLKYRVGCVEYTAQLRRDGFDIEKTWKKLRRHPDGSLERECHYPINQDYSNVPCYNCVDRTKCNADIFERLAQYEDTDLTPDEVSSMKRLMGEIVTAGITADELTIFIQNHRAN